MFSNRNVTWTKLALAAMFAFLLADGINYILYAHAIAFDLPEGDHWRWLRGGLIPLSQGDINFWQYITIEFVPLSHSHILTLVEIWLNFKLFGLDYRVESLVGLASMLAVFLVLCLQYWREPGYQVQVPVKAGLIVCFAMVLLKQSNILSWTLVQFENLYLLITIGYLVLVDKYLSSGKGKPWILPASIGVFFLGDAMGIASILGVMGYIVVFSPGRQFKLLLQLIALVAICTLVSLLLIRGINPMSLFGLPSGPGIIQYVLENFMDFCKLILMLFSEALGGPWEYRYFFTAWALARYIAGLGVACFMAIAVLNYFVYRKQLVNTKLPILLIFFSLASITGIVLTRFEDFGLDIANVNRYIRLFQVGMVGALWINSAMMVKICRERKLMILSALTSVACITVLVTGFSMSNYYYWRYVDSELKNRRDMAAAFRNYASDDTFPVGEYHARCRNHYCQDAIAFLKEKHLSVFRDAR